MSLHVSAAAVLLLAVVAAVAPTGAAAPEPAAALAAATERGQPVARVFLPRDYHGHDQIWKIAETRDGLLYFGNLDQVLEFDGLRWRSIPVPGGSFVRALATDAAGTVWVAGVNELGRLVPGEDGRLQFESLRAQVPAGLGDLGAIWSVLPMADGVWFQSSAATLRWNGAKFDVWRIGESGVVGAYPVDGRLIVSREKGWFVPRPDGQWEKFSDSTLLPRHLWRAADGRLLALTGQRGIVVVEGDKLTPIPTEADEWLRTKRPYSALPLPDGGLVVPSLQGAAIVLGPDFRVEATFDSTAELMSETVITAHLDQHGALWLGTDNGVVRLDYASPVRSFGAAHGFGRSGPESVARVDGKIFVSTARNVFELTPPERLPGNPRWRENQVSQDRVNELMRLPDGVITSGLEGLTWQSGGQTTRLPAPASVRNVRDVVRLPGEPTRLVATFINGLVSWCRDGDGWRCEGVWPELSGELRSLLLDADGALWVATPNSGVLRLEPAPREARALRLERFADEAGLPVGRRAVWLNLVAGAPLFKTHAGMFRWDAATRRFHPENAFGAGFGATKTFVRLSAEDARGGLWMAQENRDTEPSRLVYGRDGRTEQLPMPHLDLLGTFNQVFWEEHDGRELLWVAGQSELRRIDLTAWRAAAPRPASRTLLRSIQVSRERWADPRATALALRHDANTVKFAFATPAFGGEPGVLHESRLSGFPDGEPQLSAMGERTFTNLPPGAYTFEARARAEDGRWSEPARFAFTILAPWWQTTWAAAAYVICGTLALFVYVRWRIRRLLRDRRRLEDVIAHRTAELARQNVELERLHRVDQDEKLAARLAEEKAQLELLRYQLNPHFLYNSLNSIRALVFTNAEAAGEMVTRLSEFCRATLTRGTEDTTTVAQEAELLQLYLDIERTRWQDGLRTRIEIQPDARDVQVPQFLFLPLIENAIKYGSRTSPGVLEVVVSIHREGDQLVCEVANTGEWVGEKHAPPAPGAESTHIGLENLRRRLARYYGAQCRPHIVTEHGWVRVRLHLPQKTRVRGSRSPL